MSETNRVYEIVDTTNDEMYFTQGMYLLIDDAIKDAQSKTPDEWNSDLIIDDFAKIEIRERKFGWTGTDYKKVFSIEWEKTYSEQEDEYVWTHVINERDKKTEKI